MRVALFLLLLNGCRLGDLVAPAPYQAPPPPPPACREWGYLDIYVDGQMIGRTWACLSPK